MHREIRFAIDRFQFYRCVEFHSIHTTFVHTISKAAQFNPIYYLSFKWALDRNHSFIYVFFYSVLQTIKNSFNLWKHIYLLVVADKCTHHTLWKDKCIWAILRITHNMHIICCSTTRIRPKLFIKKNAQSQIYTKRIWSARVIDRLGFYTLATGICSITLCFSNKFAIWCIVRLCVHTICIYIIP